MRNFCTSYNKTYLLQGLALHKSLERHCGGGGFKLFVVCMDDESFSLLGKLRDDGIVPIRGADLETAEVAAAKERASKWQYYGVIQPLVCEYVLDKFGVDAVTYVDADIMFFSSPEPLFAEIDGGRQVSLVSHNFTPRRDLTDVSGRYCVQFNTFFNDAGSRAVLDYWKAESFRYDKRFPDLYAGQLSLDNWQSKFPGKVLEIKNIGAGVAPWNVEKFKIAPGPGGQVLIDGTPLVFYHFHKFGWIKGGGHFHCSYPMPRAAVDLIYKPYIARLEEAEAWVKGVDPSFDDRKIVPMSQRVRAALSSVTPSFAGGALRRLRGLGRKSGAP